MSGRAHIIPAEWLTAYHDGELDPARRAQVDAHLPECAECRQALADLQALSQVLALETLPQTDVTSAANFWRGVQAQLPARPAAAAAAAGAGLSGRALLRWWPGVALLLLYGAAQLAAGAGTVLVLLTAALAKMPAWAPWLYQLAASSTLGWLAWLVPAGWGGWALFLFWLLVSAELAILYLAWLGYEWRYGAPAAFGRALASKGD